jgi:hypothetical protein
VYRRPGGGSAAEAGLDHPDELLRRLRFAVQVLGGSGELLTDLGRAIAATTFHPDQDHADDDAGYQENRDHGDEDDRHVDGLSLLGSCAAMMLGQRARSGSAAALPPFVEQASSE